MKKRIVYADHNATTPLSPEALEAMGPYLKTVYGNASSLHVFGQESKKALEDAREAIAGLINAEKPEEIIFTSGGTESDNMAIKGLALSSLNKGKHIITTQVEHHAVLTTCEYLAANGFKADFVGVDKFCRVNPKDIINAVKPDTFLVSVMHANNEVGVIEPIAEIAKLLNIENEKRRSAGHPKIYFHTDAVQSAGKLKLDVAALGVDMLSISAHKFYGPKGVGAIYVKRGTPVEPILHGGHHERNLRAGTENIAGIKGMAKALEAACREREKEQPRLYFLRDRLEKGIVEKIPETTVNGHYLERISGTLNVSFKYVEGESLMLSLDLEGIAASTGSACDSGSSEPSHVLKAMGADPATAQGALRFSFGHQNTDEDIDYILEVLPRIVSRLRAMSPWWAKEHPQQ